MTQDLLQRLSPEDRRFVISRARRRKYKRSEVIFHEADLGDTIHHITSGMVAIRSTTPLGDTATLTVLVAGEVFGEGALFTPEHRRTASAVALVPTETLMFARDELVGHAAASDVLQTFVMEVLAAQVRRLTAHLLEALYITADKRVIRRLHILADKLTNDQDEVDISITQDDLATMAGTTRSTANAVLRDLQVAGVVTRQRGRITIHNVARLRQLGS